MDTKTPAEIAANEINIAKKREDEHFRLQRQVRTIEMDRKHQSMGVHPIFRNQDNQLRILKKEFLNLVKDLKVGRSGAHKKKDKRMKMELKHALFVKRQSDVEVDGSTKILDQLEGLVYRNHKCLESMRKIQSRSLGKVDSRRLLSQHKLNTTEDRLAATVKKFDAIQYENKVLREEIEHMMKERAHFNEIWSKMIKALSKGKVFLQDLFESSTAAYDQRDEWCRKLKSMLEKGKMDQLTQVYEMRDLQRALDHEMKIYKFLDAKGVKRVNPKEEQRELEIKMKEEDELRHELQVHLKILDDIKNYTGEEDIQKIISNFKKMEHEMFSKYVLLTHFCATNVVLVKEVERLRRDIEDRREYNNHYEENLSQKINHLRKELTKQRKITNSYRRRYENTNSLIKNTTDEINDIFKLLGCSLEPYENLLGGQVPSIWNVNMTLTAITSKIQEYIQVICYKERVLFKKEKTTSRLKMHTVHMQTPQVFEPTQVHELVKNEPCSSCMESRWLGRLTDSVEVPFSKEDALEALHTIAGDPAYLPSDRLHPYADCRLPKSRLAKAYLYM